MKNRETQSYGDSASPRAVMINPFASKVISSSVCVSRVATSSALSSSKSKLSSSSLKDAMTVLPFKVRGNDLEESFSVGCQFETGEGELYYPVPFLVVVAFVFDKDLACRH